MPRTARVIVPGMPLHITQRGTRRFDVFRDTVDRLEFLRLFNIFSSEFHLAILAWCLMTNHVHFVAIPEREDSVRRVFHRVNGTYARRFNHKHGFVGHLWQERPDTAILDDSHFRNAMRYVERNPVRAHMVTHAADYRWSSAAAHCFGLHDPLLEAGASSTVQVRDWAEWLEGEDNDAFERFLRECTRTGRPCGEEAFVKAIGKTTGHDFTRKKAGRKPNPPKTS